MDDSDGAGKEGRIEMDVQKYLIMLKDVGFEENTDKSVNEKNDLVLHKNYRFLTGGGEKTIIMVFDFRKHDKNIVTYYAYEVNGETYLNNDFLPHLADCKEFTVIFVKDGGKLVNGS